MDEREMVAALDALFEECYAAVDVLARAKSGGSGGAARVTWELAELPQTAPLAGTHQPWRLRALWSRSPHEEDQEHVLEEVRGYGASPGAALLAFRRVAQAQLLQARSRVATLTAQLDNAIAAAKRSR